MPKNLPNHCSKTHNERGGSDHYTVFVLLVWVTIWSVTLLQHFTESIIVYPRNMMSSYYAH